MKRLGVLIYSIIGGMCIGLGGIAYLSVDNKIAGSFFFCVGLYAIVTHGFKLFTGRVCYIFENDLSYLIDVVIIYVGNFIGTFIMGSIVHLTRIDFIAEKAQAVAAAKINDGYLSLFILAIICNILIYLAVDGYYTGPKDGSNELSKHVAVFLFIPAFIVSGVEHCIADMFYFSVAGVWSGKAVAVVLVVTLGNTVGGVIIPLVKQLVRKLEKA